MSILDWELAKTPFVVIDIETTGLSPRKDRIVEIAAALVRPGDPPTLVFETVVDPGEPMGATEIHGLTDQDVAGAPRFSEIVAPLVSVLSNRVIASHNVYFDMSILEEELSRHGYPGRFPHVCTMMMPRLVDRHSPRLSLSRACETYGVEQGENHVAASDAMAAAGLLRRHLASARKHELRTFGKLRVHTQREYEFLESFEESPLPSPPVMLAGQGLMPRSGRGKPRRRSKVARYLEAVLDVAADLRLDAEEEARIETLRREIELPVEVLRAVHAKIFWGMLSRYVEDARIDRDESSHLQQLHGLLSRLGWAPGDGERASSAMR